MTGGFSEKRYAQLEGSVLVSFETDHWISERDIGGRPLIVFVHGHMSSLHAVNKLARYFSHLGYAVAAFNYSCGIGIDAAAATLERRLTPLANALTPRGFAIVGHSLGGLVARAFEHKVSGPLASHLRGVVTLGSPHAGLPEYSKFVETLIRSSEVVTRDLLLFSSKTVDQLRGKDPGKFLKSMNAETPRATPHLSVSGGSERLKPASPTGTQVLLAPILHRRLQRIINEKPNDGLLGESATNLCRNCGRPGATHKSHYAEFQNVDHFRLVNNQEVSEIVGIWLKEVCFPAPAN